MVTYRYALADGKVVDAEALRNQEDLPVECYCLACEGRMIAKVRGLHNQPHFAHHPGSNCNPETYLHRLGKQAFYEVFNECLVSGGRYEIVLDHPIVCRRFESSLGFSCPTDRTQEVTYNLLDYYDKALLEKRDGTFIPDLLLFKTSNPARRIYVEIAVTHFLSEAKERSCERIIEISLERESDLAKITGRKLTQLNAKFFNFRTATEVASDSECKCAGIRTHAFTVYKSGKSHLADDTMASIASSYRKNESSIAYFRLIDPKTEDFGFSESYLYKESVRKAAAEGFPIRNCYLCIHQGNNFRKATRVPIYCKRFHKVCDSSEAIQCSEYACE